LVLAVLGLAAIARVSPAFGDVITGGTYTGMDAPAGSGEPGADGYVFDDGASTVSGGTFTGGAGGSSTSGAFSNGGSGGNGATVFSAGTTVAITGGSYTGGVGGAASGGTDLNVGGDGGNGLEVYTTGAAATVSGGSFAGAAGGSGSTLDGSAGYSFYTFSGGSITIVGTFQNAPASPVTHGSGSFTGTLADNSTPATYTYDANGGTLTFTSAPVPEPTSLGLLAVGSLTLLRRRRQG
jgi:hypothetical protein